MIKLGWRIKLNVLLSHLDYKISPYNVLIGGGGGLAQFIAGHIRKYSSFQISFQNVYYQSYEYADYNKHGMDSVNRFLFKLKSDGSC